MTSTWPKIQIVLDETTLTFEKEDVTSAVVVEEVHPITNELPIGKLEFNIISTDSSFSMFSDGYSGLLSGWPVVTLYEVVDDVDVELGTYYLDDWENISENEYKLVGMDIIGVLEATPFEGFFWDSLTTVEQILIDTLGLLGINYEVDNYTAAKELEGWIPPGTYRTALQQVLFAAGAIAVSARDKDNLQIIRSRISDYYAIFADKDNEYMTFPAYSPIGNDFTIEMLIRVNAYDVFGRVLEADDGNPEIIFYENGGNLLWHIEDDASLERNGEFGAYDITDGLWHQIAITFDQSGNAIGYLDGAGNPPVDVSGLGNITITNAWYLAKLIAGGGGSVEMDCAYLRIWSDVRTPSELAENAFRRTPLDETNLERNYTFRELDETDFANGQDGTFAGSITFGRTPGQYALPAYDQEILDSEKANRDIPKLKPLVTSIELISHNYTESSELLDIYEEDLEEGVHKIIFDQPLFGIVVNGPGYIPASLITEDGAFLIVTEDEAFEIEIGGDYSFGSNSVTLVVESPGGTVTITGFPYVDSQRAFPFVESGIIETTDTNKFTVKTATLISADNVEEILDLMRDYYQMRYEQGMLLLPTTTKPSDVIQTSTYFNKNLVGVIEKMELRLTTGYLAQTRMISREV